MPPESPYLYGLHPNAEIGFLTTTSESLFRTVFEMQPRDAGSSGAQTVTREDKVRVLPHCMLRFYRSVVLISFCSISGKTNVGRNHRKGTGRVQHGGNNGKSRGKDTLRYRGIPRVRTYELFNKRIKTIIKRIRSRFEGNGT